MQPSERLPNDQAEATFTSESIDRLIENVTEEKRVAVMDTIVSPLVSPDGKHRLSNQDKTKLAGFNTVEAFQRVYRVIFQARDLDGTELIEIVTIGPRRNGEVYAEAHDLINSGKLTSEEQTQIWDAIKLLDDTKERIGLESWDHFEKPAPLGMIKAAVAGGILDETTAGLLTQEELSEAMAAAYESGVLDSAAALRAAMTQVSLSATPDRVFASRGDARCGAYMPIAKKHCIRAQGHAGAHRGHR